MPAPIANRPARPARWLLPSLTHWLWLLIFATLLTGPWRTALISADGDPCWHWRLGEEMLATGRIVDTDTLSHTRYGAPFLTKEWLSEVLLAIGGAFAGLTGLAVVGALVIAATFGLLHRQLLREGNDVLVATLVILLAAWASTTHWIARPHLFSLLFTVLWHGALRRYARDARPGPLAVALAGLTLFWVNLHGGFLVGFILLGIYWTGALIEMVRDRLVDNARGSARPRAGPAAPAHVLVQLTGVGLLCFAVSLVNPTGWRLHLHNLAFLQSKFFTGWLVEYQSTNFQSAGAHGFLAWLLLLVLVLALARPRLTPTDILLLLVWVYFALYAGRNIPLLALITAPVLAPGLADGLRRTPWLARARWGELADRMTMFNSALRGGLLTAGLAVLLVFAVPRPTTMPPDRWPVAAVEYVQAHATLFRGPVFNQYAWGGYLIRYLPEHRVFVDGRADFYGEDLVREFDDTTALRPNWQDPLVKYGITWTLMPKDHRLNQAVAALGWQQVYQDDVAVIYRRQP